MQGKQINDHLRASLAILVESADELRDLDQALGDGDLGITITAGSNAVIAELEKLPADATPTEIARTCAKAFANANPSTMAALVAGALLSGSRTWEGKQDIGPSGDDVRGDVLSGDTGSDRIIGDNGSVGAQAVPFDLDGLGVYMVRRRGGGDRGLSNLDRVHGQGGVGARLQALVRGPAK